MDKILFIHWNIYYKDNEEFYISEIQQLHLNLLKQYSALFNKVIIVLHTKDIHDITTIHTVKVVFDKIFNYKLVFYVEPYKYESYIKTFNDYFLPILNNEYANTSLLYYVSDFGEINDEQIDVHKQIIENEYTLNFKNLYDTISDFERNYTSFTCGNIYVVDNNKKATNPIFGISPKNYRIYCMQNNIPEYTRWKADCFPGDYFINLFPDEQVYTVRTQFNNNN